MDKEYDVTSRVVSGNEPLDATRHPIRDGLKDAPISNGDMLNSIVDPSVKKAITVAIINNMPFIQTPFFESSVALLFETSKNYELSWMNVKTFPVDFARNWAVKRFLGTKQYESCEWIGWLDTDMTFPKDMFNIMLDECEKKNIKVMSAVYFKRNFKNEVVGWRYGYDGKMSEPVLDGTIQEVEVMGMGACVIHRSVLEKVGYPWFKYGSLHEKVEGLATEDIQFCERCKEVGEKIYMHTGIYCGHLMTIENVHNRIVCKSMSDGPASAEVGK
jgi:hypothetical protein